MAKSALNTSSDSKGKKRHNVSFSNDTKNSSNNNNVSFDTTFDTTFDENVLQYSADEKPWDGNLFDSDDPFLTDPKALDRLYSTNGDSEQRPLVSIRVQERLSILFDEVSSSPATRVIGTVHLTPFNNNATIDTFCLTVKDRRGQVERWEEQGGVCKNISATALHKALDPSDQIFRISPKHAETLEAPVLAYSCVPQLTPMPMLVKSKINRQGTNCQVSIKVRANPKNKKPLEKMVVMMVVPPDVNGESLSCSRKGGLWDGMKRTLFWTHGRLQPGEMIEIRAQFDCIDGGDSMVSNFPILTRCDGKSLFSRVELTSDYTDNQSFPVTLFVEQRSRVIYRKH